MDEIDIRTVFGKRLLLADGSTGTALEALAPGRSAVLLPLEDPGLVEDLHRAYFDAGSDIVATATFSASERSLARMGAAGRARALNRAGAEAAVRAARKARLADGRPRWVAGSVGPGEEPPSLGAASYEELAASYLPQMLGLLEGGADLIILETCQDPLQIKAAIGALYDAQEVLGRSVPFVVSATVDASGRMLTGTGMAALAAIFAPFNPLALGLNCSGGPGELAAPLAELAGLSPLPLTLMPNAGLPTLEGSRVVYPLNPEDFARATSDLALRYGVALVGGCCGTGPEHIRALADLLKDRPEPSKRPVRRPALASLYEAWSDVFLRVGEKANAAGSAVFSKLVLAEDLEGQAAFALAQEEAGAHALDLHLARPGRDEATDLKALTARIMGSARAALSLDSADPDVLAAALPKVGGRPLLNSANLEDEGKVKRLFRLAVRFGAGVVCLALDGRGPARSAADKVRICRRLYDLALAEGLAPQDLYFDCLTFSLASESKGFEGAAAQTLKAIPLVKKACPGSGTILGVGNISFGLPKPLRSSVTALFLDAARGAGLDAAILDPSLPNPSSASPAMRTAVETLLSAGAPPEERAAAMDDILALEPGQALPAAAPVPGDASPSDRLESSIQRGEAKAAREAALAILADGSSQGAGALTSIVARSMSLIGGRFASGSLPLPRVLRGAEAAQAALGVLAQRADADNSQGKTIVLATVKGDLHDIGKNLTGLILAGSGYRVVDLGVDVGTERLLEAVRAEKAAALGLSGLLTRSLQEMRKTALAMEAEGLSALLLLGGAAVDREFVVRTLAPLRPGRVRACSDAFEALRVLGGAEEAAPEARGLDASPAGSQDAASRDASAAEGKTPGPRGSPGDAPLRPVPAWKPPFLGHREVEELALDDLLGALDERTLLRVRWGYGGKGEEEAREAFDRVVDFVRSRELCRARGVYGYFPCASIGDGILRVGGGSAAKEFRFPVEKGGKRRSVAKYFRESGDFIPFFAVTAGSELSRGAAEMRAAGAYEDYFRLHAFSAALAEAAAELLHGRIGRELVASGAESAGRRYSFGYPACPGVEAQDDLLSLLDARSIGVDVTEGHQLSPEFSVTALIVPRRDAEYFSA